jgi:hypothetical protein
MTLTVLWRDLAFQKICFFIVFLNFSGTVFCIDFQWVLASISAPFWEPLAKNSHTFSRLFFNWFVDDLFKEIYSKITLNRSGKWRHFPGFCWYLFAHISLMYFGVCWVHFWATPASKLDFSGWLFATFPQDDNDVLPDRSKMFCSSFLVCSTWLRRTCLRSGASRMFVHSLFNVPVPLCAALFAHCARGYERCQSRTHAHNEQTAPRKGAQERWTSCGQTSEKLHFGDKCASIMWNIPETTNKTS